MPNSVSKRYSRIALLAVLAVIASLFALPVAPAGATEGEADFAADFTACPSSSIPDAGFSDTASSFATDWIDCIAYYGVTQGAGSATTYKPSSPVLRWQMALFLIRAAGPAGVSIPAASDQGFTDIGGLPQDTQDKINQLAALGITQGKGSATTFAPMDPVTRNQMALFLARFLDDVAVGPGGVDIDDIDDGDIDDGDQFGDIGQVSVEAYDAILRLFEMGVTTGTGDGTTFSPNQVVSRAQMAAFIGRTLGHSNARPAGVTMQAAPASDFGAFSTDVAISYRDSNFMPVSNVLVDVFQSTWSTGGTEPDPLESNGQCDTGVVSATFGPDVCEIDLTDVATNSLGNIEATRNVADGKTVQWWAWTGDVGDDFDADDVTPATATAMSSANATDFDVDTNVAKYADTNGSGDTIVKNGSTVEVTVQLTDGTNDVAKSGVSVIFTHQRWDDPGEGAADLLVQSSSTIKTDAEGKAVFSITYADPTNGDDDPVYDDVDINVSGIGLDSLDFEWSDDSRVATTIVGDAGDGWTTGSSMAVTATVYDQYGTGMGNQSVTFDTDDENGVGATYTAILDSLGTHVVRTTGPNGVATLTIPRHAGFDNGEEIVTVWLDTDGQGDADEAIEDDVVFYFAKSSPSNGTYDYNAVNVDFDPVAVDTDNDAFVAYYDADNLSPNDGAYWAFTYDPADDQFQILGSPADSDDWEDAFQDDDELVVTLTSGKDLFNIAVNN